MWIGERLTWDIGPASVWRVMLVGRCARCRMDFTGLFHPENRTSRPSSTGTPDQPPPSADGPRTRPQSLFPGPRIRPIARRPLLTRSRPLTSAISVAEAPVAARPPRLPATRMSAHASAKSTGLKAINHNAGQLTGCVACFLNAVTIHLFTIICFPDTSHYIARKPVRQWRLPPVAVQSSRIATATVRVGSATSGESRTPSPLRTRRP